jgi:hypothetical protein
MKTMLPCHCLTPPFTCLVFSFLLPYWRSSKHSLIIMMMFSHLPFAEYTFYVCSSINHHSKCSNTFALLHCEELCACRCVVFI